MTTRPRTVKPAAAPQDPASDEQLAARACGGCAESFTEIDRRYRARLIHLLWKRVGNEADAEDLAQRALMRAYRNLDRFDPKRKWSTWLITIAMRLAVDEHRKASRLATQRAPVTLADPMPGPMHRAIAGESRDNLWALADRVLPAPQWTALWLHYGEQQEPAEVAAAMGLSRVHVRVLLHRARKTLAKHIKETNETRVQAEPATERAAAPPTRHVRTHRGELKGVG